MLASLVIDLTTDPCFGERSTTLSLSLQASAICQKETRLTDGMASSSLHADTSSNSGPSASSRYAVQHTYTLCTRWHPVSPVHLTLHVFAPAPCHHAYHAASHY